MSISGPYPPAVHDITVFRGGENTQAEDTWDNDAIYFQVKNGKRIVGNSGYRGEPSKLVVKRDEHSPEFKEFIGRVLSRQETLFKGLKDFKILADRFAYGRNTVERMALHKTAVEAIAVIKQYDYENGHPPFEV